MKKITLLMMFTCLQLLVQAQAASDSQPDVMRSNGKIYVVMTVVLIILTGLVIYLFSLDRKISKLEKKN